MTELLRGMSCGSVSYASISLVDGDDGAVGVDGGEDDRAGDSDEKLDTLLSAPILESNVVFELEVDSTLPGGMNIDDLERGGLEVVIA